MPEWNSEITDPNENKDQAKDYNPNNYAPPDSGA